MVNNNILYKIDTKLEGATSDSNQLLKGFELINLLKTCYKNEFEFVTKEINKVIKSKNKKYKKILENLNDLKINNQKVVLNGKEVSLLSVEQINGIFSEKPFANIKTIFCLIPENLILLSLGENNEIS